MPPWMAAWGEEDPGKEYRRAARRGERAMAELVARRMEREAVYWAPIRAAEAVARLEEESAAIERQRAAKAAYMRRYRAEKAARRRLLDRGA
jgi:hypothetical protein